MHSYSVDDSTSGLRAGDAHLACGVYFGSIPLGLVLEIDLVSLELRFRLGERDFDLDICVSG